MACLRDSIESNKGKCKEGEDIGHIRRIGRLKLV